MQFVFELPLNYSTIILGLIKSTLKKKKKKERKKNLVEAWRDFFEAFSFCDFIFSSSFVRSKVSSSSNLISFFKVRISVLCSILINLI